MFRRRLRLPINSRHSGHSKHRWAGRYFLGKELLWCVYFIAHGSWSALAGVGLFLAYPFWRRLWRRWHPIAATP